MRQCFLLVLLATHTAAAELVSNGGFENLISTLSSPYPTGIGEAADWVSAGGSPDFYTTATMTFYGYSAGQSCYAGNACAGMLNAPPVPG
jgi:hypothetical protein